MSVDPQEFNRRRKSRALVTAGLLVAMVVLFYLITLTRLLSA
jgi:hypothetical protein